MRGLLFLVLFVIAAQCSWAQLTLILNDLPASTPADADIYLAASINGWDPMDEDFRFTQAGGEYTLHLPGVTNTFEGKFTRGGWPTVEGTAQGGFRPNRTFSFQPGDTLFLSIAGWEDLVVSKA